MTLNFKAMRLVMRLAYGHIKRLDRLTDNRLDKSDHMMIIRKIDHIYHIDIYNKDKLVYTQLAFDDYHIDNKLMGFIFDVMFISACMIIVWNIGGQVKNMINSNAIDTE